MIMHRGVGAALVVMAAIAFAGCDESLSTLAGPTPNLEPTFRSIQQFIFEANDSAGRASCTGCHTNVGRNPSAGLNLLGASAYPSLVGVPSNAKPGAVRVIPGDPENSYLVQKLEGHPGIVGLRMPRTGGPYLAEGQMLFIKRWIARGAPND